jgi:hypothetical protein
MKKTPSAAVLIFFVRIKGCGMVSHAPILDQEHDLDFFRANLLGLGERIIPAMF